MPMTMTNPGDRTAQHKGKASDSTLERPDQKKNRVIGEQGRMMMIE